MVKVEEEKVLWKFACGHELEIDKSTVMGIGMLGNVYCPDCWGLRIKALCILRPSRLAEAMGRPKPTCKEIVWAKKIMDAETPTEVGDIENAT